MKGLALIAILGFAMSPAFGESKDPAAKTLPAYDTSAEVNLSATIAQVVDVKEGGALDGVNLKIKVKGDLMDVYVAPAEFVKLFDVKMAKDDDVEILGSKVKFAAGDMILAREVKVGHTTLVVRDKGGEPLWKFFLKTIPTGL
jgi:hypothetical protein